MTANAPDPLPAELERWLAGHVQTTEWRYVAGAHEQSTIWCGLLGTQRVGILKMHHHGDGARREAEVYAALGTQPLRGFPQLLAIYPKDPRHLLLSYVPGRPDFLTTADILAAAGERLRALHQVDHADRDPLALNIAFQKRFSNWADLSRDRVDPVILDTVEEKLRGVPSVPRVWCHRDYHPRNWRWEPDVGTLQIIDLGQARPDLWLVDCVHVFVLARDEPQLKSAFLAGYGRGLIEAEVEVVDGLIGLYGLGCLVWGHQHGSARALSDGRRYLDYLRLSRP